MVDVTVGHELLSFIDTYSGYNHILMYEPDEEHTSFIIDCRLYYYRVMSFDLKNTGATYQRLINMMFRDLIGNTMAVYVDDMLVKSRMARNQVEHLRQMFNVL